MRNELFRRPDTANHETELLRSEEPPVLKDRIRAALKVKKCSKATGGDQMPNASRGTEGRRRDYCVGI